MKAHRSQVVIVFDKDFSFLAMQMATNHHCKAFSYDVSFIIGTYLNTCVKVLATSSVLDPKGRILAIFQYLREELSHGR